jgi:hypothetical protein
MGTEKLAEVVIIKDGKVVYSAQPMTKDVSFEYVDKEKVTGRHYYYVRVQQTNRMLAWSSPFFINFQ